MRQDWRIAKDAGLWSWSPRQWAWSLETVRWSLDLGLPKAPVYFDVSTDAVPPDARYESGARCSTTASRAIPSRPMPRAASAPAPNA